MNQFIAFYLLNYDVNSRLINDTIYIDDKIIDILKFLVKLNVISAYE